VDRVRPTVVAGVVLIALFAVPSALSRTSAEPEAFQLWKASRAPRAGTQFTGVVATLLRQAEITMRPESFRFHCGRASITPRGKRRPVVHAPVRMVKLPDRGSTETTGGPVIGIWVCTWTVPRGTAGWRMVGSYGAKSIGRDPVTGADLGYSSEGGPLYWTVSR